MLTKRRKANIADPDTSKKSALLNMSLPLPGTFERWTPERKRALVTAVAFGDMTLASACEAYGLDEAEIRSWQMLYAERGLRGLKVTVRQ